MSGELSPSGGRVLVAGHDVHKSATARRLVALVPSNPELPDFLTVTEAFEFAASIRRSPAWNGAEYCAELHLDPHLRLGNASAGERRKAELICGLAGDPRVLLLDETFTHLDDDSARKLRQWVVEWSASRVILLTQHQGAPVSPDARLQVTQGRVTFTADRGRDRPGRRL